MAKSNDLDWWLALVQVDLSRLHKGTIKRLISELDHRLNDPDETAGWNAPKVKPADFFNAAASLKRTLNTMKDGDPVEATYVVHEHWSTTREFEGDLSNSISECWVDTENINETCVAMFLKSWRLAMLNGDKMKTCPVCGKLYAQRGKREKLFCSTQCRNKSHKNKKEG